MKKLKLIALPVAAALCIGGAACAKKTADEAPVITGVTDKICAAGETYDLLAGIAALDREDGDITPKLKITVDGDRVDGFYTEFEREDDYKVVYTVTDSKGHTAEETATISTIARAEYKRFSLADFGGFGVETAGAAKCVKTLSGDGDRSILNLKITGAQGAADVVLARGYKLKTGAEYTFKYYLASSVAGTAKAKVGAADAADLPVAVGDNALTFTYAVPADADNETVETEVKLLLGALGDAEIDFDKAEAAHSGVLEKNVTLEKGTNCHDRFDGTQGSVTVAADGASATLEITSAHADDRWRGGMFVNAGLNLVAGETYTVSCDVTAAHYPFGIVLQNKQWGETRYGYETVTEDGKVVSTVTPAADGGLWLYVEAGDAVNEITLSNIKITGSAEQTVTESFTCANVFKMFAYAGAQNYVQWQDGKLIFEVEQFGNQDWHTKIESPQFYVDTAGMEFMISFRAYATAPVQLVWVGPKSGGWDPNLIWQQFNLSDREQVYTFKGNESDASNHQFEWQFGFTVNQKYENVKIVISDIVIYFPDGVLDG